MTRLRVALRIAIAPGRRLWAWWGALEATERVLYRSLVLLAAGFALIYPPLALIVPGSILALAFFGFGFGRRA